MRKKILAANWKMNLTQAEAETFLTAFLSEIGEVNDVEVVLIPSFTSIPALAERLATKQFLRLGAQNLYWEKSGAFTGEISAGMLRALYVKYVIVGHSERRQLFHEDDQMVNRKLKAALEAGLRPILCVGETQAERKAGRVEEVLEGQLREGLAGVSHKDLHEIVVAYEPVWAIGTGATATPEEAQNAHLFIRQTLAELSDKKLAQRLRIQYGGSVKPDNCEALMRQKDIDGALVGTASLDPRSFALLVRCAEAALA
jgi:triosephosphate isomerase (TIM)